MRRLCDRVVLALVGFAPVYWGALADNGKPPVPATDAELLEFLGSVDSGADSQATDDGSWIDYLSQTDIVKVAKTNDPNGTAAAKQVTVGSAPPATGVKKDE
jgi:hypothetical protein